MGTALAGFEGVPLLPYASDRSPSTPLHGSLSAWRTALFAALGFSAAAGCGANVDSPVEPAADNGSPLATPGEDTAMVHEGLVCQNPLSATRVNDESVEAGYVACGGGWLHRPQAVECPSIVPRAASIVGYDSDTCEDSSCTAKPHGFCFKAGGLGPTVACMYGCVRDDECNAGQICFCDHPVGRCVQASCATDADCPGSLCVGTPNRPPCGEIMLIDFACHDPQDECLAGSDCEPGLTCQSNRHPGSARECTFGAVCGRPFLVDGRARRAEVQGRSDWVASSSAPDLSALSAGARQLLSAHWTDLGLMEHASVAAFARFVLELLAAGAPAELLSSAQRALGDEIEHARLCFGLASAYAAAPLGPATLSVRGVLDAAGLGATVRAAIVEACIGETLAAVEALEALAGATDPAVRQVLEQIARDESAHAELGWRFLKWALSGASHELCELARCELERAIEVAVWDSEPSVEPNGAEPGAELEAHGLCPPERRRAARRAALSHLVAPLARALLVTPLAHGAAVDRKPLDGESPQADDMSRCG